MSSDQLLQACGIECQQKVEKDGAGQWKGQRWVEAMNWVLKLGSRGFAVVVEVEIESSASRT
jgi:hypothetical protein